MKKIFCALILVLCVVTPSFPASRQEMKRMSTFLSNFTELGMCITSVYNFRGVSETHDVNCITC